KVDVIFAAGTPAAAAAKQATSVIPIVFAGAGDPVGSGLVAGLARSGGNVTAAERNAVITGIQDGSVEVAILQIDAAGSALNLQAANRIIMLEPSWTPGANHQAVARAVRIGQRNPVLISWPTVRHSIDEAVMRVLRRKQDGLTELWRAAS